MSNKIYDEIQRMENLGTRNALMHLFLKELNTQADSRVGITIGILPVSFYMLFSDIRSTIYTHALLLKPYPLDR